MAYLRSLKNKCQGRVGTCPKTATVELIDRWNGAIGKYCVACGKRALEEQQRREDA
jgi:hypothetical protein